MHQDGSSARRRYGADFCNYGVLHEALEQLASDVARCAGDADYEAPLLQQSPEPSSYSLSLMPPGWPRLVAPQIPLQNAHERPAPGIDDAVAGYLFESCQGPVYVLFGVGRHDRGAQHRPRHRRRREQLV